LIEKEEREERHVAGRACCEKGMAGFVARAIKQIANIKSSMKTNKHTHTHNNVTNLTVNTKVREMIEN
jgi:hypothetical protein